MCTGLIGEKLRGKKKQECSFFSLEIIQLLSFNFILMQALV